MKTIKTHKTIKAYILLITLSITLLSLPFLLVNCGKDDDGDQGESLYQKLGERAGIESAVEQSILAIASDPLLTPFFKVVLVDEGAMGAGLDALKENLADFIDEASGGNANYNGLSMVEAHSPGNPRMTNANEITNAAYDAFLDAMIQGAQDAGLSDAATLEDYRDLLEESRSAIVN